MSNKVYIGIIAALLAVVCFMAYSINKKDKEMHERIIYMNAENGKIIDEREGIEMELEAMKLNYDTMSVDNSEMRAKIDAQISEISSLQKKVKNRDYDITKLRSEAETLRSIMKDYIHQIDSLNQANQRLTIERDNEATRANQAETNLKDTQGELNTTKEMVKQGSVLNAGEFVNTGIFERNTGKQVETDRASKVEMIKSCFKIRKNTIAKPGNKTLFVSITGPDGAVLSGKGSGKTSIGGSDINYSVSREVDYQGNDVDVCVYYTANAGYEFKKGNYKLNIYESGALIGTSTVALK
jgi:hypothetical protein